MFDQLIESRPKRERTTGEMLASIVVHGALITGAAVATSSVAEPGRVWNPDTTGFVLDHLPPAPATPQRQPEVETTSASRPAAFQPLPTPVQIPTSVSPVKIRESFDPTSFARRQAAGGIPNAFPDDGVVPGDRFTAHQVDGQASYLNGPEPRYPPALKAAGVEGRVTLEFVVDTDGLVEAASIVVLDTTNPAFDGPSIDAVRGSRFRPAMIGGRAVRQLVRQVVRYTITG